MIMNETTGVASTAYLKKGMESKNKMTFGINLFLEV